jgi:hypothetical protein
MIQRAHQTSINVEIRIDLDRCDTEAQALQQCTSAGSNHTLADPRDNTTRDNNILGHDRYSVCLMKRVCKGNVQNEGCLSKTKEKGKLF